MARGLIDGRYDLRSSNHTDLNMAIHPEGSARFGVNVRTIQRDINEQFGYLPLEKIDGT